MEGEMQMPNDEMYWELLMEQHEHDVVMIESRKEEVDGIDYERAIEQLEHDTLCEPTFNPEDGSM